MKKVKPFLKWAGGKTQLANTIQENFPKNIEKISSYYEPFLGGGSVFLFVASNFSNIKSFYINDINPDIYNCWNIIKNQPRELIDRLGEIKSHYINLDDNERKEYYYSVRKLYNTADLSNIERALYTIFLNKTCFNGLYRLNSKNEFNVPIGRYTNPEIFCPKNIINISKLLEKATITNLDFADINYKDDAFIYFDPPYRPLSPSSSFNSYNSKIFDDSEQIRLSKLLKKIKNNNYLMLSNSDPKNIDCNDNFFDNMYSDFKIQRVHANRVINSKSSHRGNITELLITNY